MKKKLPNFNDVKPHCVGQWEKIFTYVVGPAIQPALDNRPNHAPCPVFGGKDSFRLYHDFDSTGGGYSNKAGRGFNDGFTLLAWILDINPVDALNIVAGYLNLVDKNGHLSGVNLSLPRALPKPVVEKPSEKNRQKLNTLWKESRDMIDGSNDNPVLHYFRNRGIALNKLPTSFDESVLHFHPNHAYYEKVQGKKYPVKCYGKFPTLVAMVTNPFGKAVSLHRTYLDTEGKKAPVPYPKKMMSGITKGNTIGSSVKLFKAHGCSLGLAEGIETALAVAQVSQMPVWAALHTEGLKAIIIPEYITHVFIWCDKDNPCDAHPSGAGYEAAMSLKIRLEKEGKTVQLLIPPLDITEGKKSVDWLDVLNDSGEYFFPIINRKFHQIAPFLVHQAC